jgi:hypothetical protein
LGLNKKNFTKQKLEQLLILWEHDTNIGEVIPIERAELLGTEGKIEFDRYKEVVGKVYEHWLS